MSIRIILCVVSSCLILRTSKVFYFFFTSEDLVFVMCVGIAILIMDTLSKGEFRVSAPSWLA